MKEVEIFLKENVGNVSSVLLKKTSRHDVESCSLKSWSHGEIKTFIC
jgi:hypothetical protein